MSRSKLTPCRKVGLSRKKNTPLKTVESLLIDNVDETSSTPKTSEKINDLKPLIKNEINNDSPCRQVGLSRKRKTSTPLENFRIQKNVCTPSNEKIIRTKTTKIKEEANHTETSLDCSSENKDITVINTEISESLKSQEDSHVSCAKKLSNLFSSPSGAKKKHKTKKLAASECFIENKISESDQEKVSCNDNIPSKYKVINNTENVENLDEFSIKNGEKENSHDIDVIEEHNGSIVINTEKSVQSNTNVVNSTFKKQNQSQFIKVCYSNEKENKNNQDGILKDRKTKEQKTYCELSEDDDDFEILPKKKKPKKLLERSKTEVGKKAKKSSKNELKKSLSVGDSRLRTLTESSITSSTSSLNLLNDCFVKLEKFKESTAKHNPCLTPQEQSDDDFEVITCTPKEIKIKNFDRLEKEVEEKRQILEDLKRAKMLKRMHSTEDLRLLTSRWKHGCVNALQDLLKQLNMHAYMDMETLLKKLNIPEDFIPSSQ